MSASASCGCFVEKVGVGRIGGDSFDVRPERRPSLGRGARRPYGTAVPVRVGRYDNTYE